MLEPHISFLHCSDSNLLFCPHSVGSPSNLLLGRDEWLGRPVTHLPQGAMLTVNTNSSVSIKSEPVSPGRDRSTPCPPPSSSTPVSTATAAGGAILTAPPQYPGSLLCLEPPTGRSPADSVSSNASSFEGSDRDDTGGGGGGGGGSGGGTVATASINPADLLIRAASEQEQDGGNVKRMRLDAWAT